MLATLPEIERDGDFDTTDAARAIVTQLPCEYDPLFPLADIDVPEGPACPPRRTEPHNQKRLCVRPPDTPHER